MAAVIQSEQMSGLASDEQSQGRRIATEFGVALLFVLLFFFIVLGIMNLYFQAVAKLARDDATD